jgi:uncharacterized protein YcbK (DUF882 family)
MLGRTECVSRRALKRAAILLAGLVAGFSVTAQAAAETRTLKLYHVHLREKTEITYKRDGKFLPDGLKKANWALRDWRENKPTNMDPKLLDLLYEAYKQSGSRDYIHVIGGYRSPGTNKMLRSRSSGVAGTSLHMSGKAVDWYLPDVPLKKLRDIGLKMQIGGVGYYPRSGSPFVHYDTGKGRYWPRMSRTELASVFPRGNTIHLPADGKPLPGYETALASYAKRKGANDVQIASGSGGRTGGGRSLLAAIFGGGADEAEDEAEAQTAPAAARPARRAPEPAVVVAEAAPVPPKRATTLPAGLPMPERDSFDGSAPGRATPPAGIPTQEPEVQVAALAPGRVPLPTFAANRPALAGGAAPPAPPPAELPSQLVAAIEEQEVAPSAPGQLAYSVPMPRERPPFEAVLRASAPAPSETVVAALVSPTPRPGLVAAAVAPKIAPDLTPEAIIAAAASLEAPAASRAAHVAASPILAAVTAAPARQDEKPVQVASLERSAAPAPVAVRSGKGGRVVGDTAVQPRSTARSSSVTPASAQAIARRIEIASLITAPERRAIETPMARPVADNLIGDKPDTVFDRGFTRKGTMPSATGRFEGKAVNFLPVRKLD